jgi:hypothetical protein
MREGLLMRRNSKPAKVSLTVPRVASTSKNVQLTGESASADKDTSEAYPEQSQKVMEETKI